MAFYVEKETWVEKKKITRLTRTAVPSHSEDVWSGQQLRIPPLPPSFQPAATLLTYIVQVLLSCEVLTVSVKIYMSIDFRIKKK